MNKAEERARAFYLPIVMVLGNPDGLYQEECFARDCKIKGFVDGYEQAEKDLTDKAKFSSGWDGFYYWQGYKQGKADFMEKSEKWWYEHLVGFLKEGLTEGVINEFKQFMSE